MGPNIKAGLLLITAEAFRVWLNKSRKPRYKGQFTPAPKGVTHFFVPTDDDKFVAHMMRGAA